MDFAAGIYPSTDFNGFFGIPTGPGQRMQEAGPGVFTYNLPMILDQPIDLFYWSSAYVEVKEPDTAGLGSGTSINAVADFSNTYILEDITLYDSNGDEITNWTMEETSSGIVMFDQNGRTPAASGTSAPEPTTLALLASGGAALLIRKRRRL
jgi:hypothetical protein